MEHAVQLVNTALPVEKRIRLSPEPAPPLTALAAVPDGQIFIDFAPSANDWDLGAHYTYSHSASGNRVMVTEADPIFEFDIAAQRWEYIGMRAGRMWFDRAVLETMLRTAWVRDWETGEWEEELLDSRPVESDSVQPVWDDLAPSTTFFRPFRCTRVFPSSR